MDKLRLIFGRLLFWASWPFLFFYLRGTLRTRVIIEHDGEILMIRGWHDGKIWALPGGGVHYGEKPENSAIREVAEEVGISLNRSQLVDLGVAEYRQFGITFSIQRYGCKLVVRPNTKKQHLEVISLAWFKLSDIKQHMVEASTWEQLKAWQRSAGGSD